MAKAPPRSEMADTPPQRTADVPPLRDTARASDVMLTEIAKLQSDGEYTKRDIGELRTDMRDIRDRMARLEERVSHLPSKEFIVGVVLTTLLIIGALTALAPKIQAFVGTAPSAISPVTGSPPH